MSNPVIHVENLSKRYRLGEREVDRGLRHVLNRAISAPARIFRSRKPASHNGDQTHFWALKDVSFEVYQGDVVGIIGRNGAGKSTLLKILSRITKPTTGFAEVRGRLGSLLEVGTGFHPELTGRENTFLNGAILGMSKKEITRKFDEIVAFAEIDKFIDTPVKHYSSGMQVRLAFSVAAHLEPEILLVDEVLAVGDVGFQRKCLGKMGDVSKAGRTIIFVSHNMGAVRTLCKTGILIKGGKITEAGDMEGLIDKYMDESLNLTDSHITILPKPAEDRDVWMESVAVLCNSEPKSTLETGDKLSLEIKFRSRTPIQKPIIGYLIRSSRGENAVNANNYFLPSATYPTPVTEGTIVCDLGDLPLMAGSYSVSFWLCRNPRIQHHVEDVLRFTVEDKDIWGNGVLPTRSLSCLWWPTQFRFSGN